MSRKGNQVYRNYFGSKNGSGVMQQIINQIRPHDVYWELFAGSGAVLQAKKPAPLENVVNDISFDVVNRWNSCSVDIPVLLISCCDAADYFRKAKFSSDLRYCIYLDPPYPLGSRRSAREVYKYEMTDSDHVELLWLVNEISARCPNVDFLISIYENQIYTGLLAGWRVHPFQAQTSKGPATELLYMNYQNNQGHLHQYDYMGTDCTDRQGSRGKSNGRFLN